MPPVQKEETYKEPKVDDPTCSRESEDDPTVGENSPIEQVALTDDRRSISTNIHFPSMDIGNLGEPSPFVREPVLLVQERTSLCLRDLRTDRDGSNRFFKGQKCEFSLNPGPFNVKEHVLVTIFANARAGSVYAIHVVSTVKVFYKEELNFLVALLVVLTTQVLGFGWAGLFQRYLVEPAAMWWPQNLRASPMLLVCVVVEVAQRR